MKKMRHAAILALGLALGGCAGDGLTGLEDLNLKNAKEAREEKLKAEAAEKGAMAPAAVPSPVPSASV